MWQNWRENGDDTDRGASPIVGITLLFGMVLIGAILVFVVGSAMFGAVESQTHGEQSEQTLKQFDKDLTTAGMQNDTSGSVYFDEQMENEIVSDGELKVTVSDGYVSNTNRPIELRTLVTVDEGGNEFAYQAGGIWRVNGDRATAISNPDLRYYTESVNDEQVGRVDISPVTVDGTVDTGEHAVQQTSTESFRSFEKDIDYVNYVTVEVSDTTYHYGWYEFLKDEFNATDESEVSADCANPGNVDENIICHDESGETVTVVATVGGQTPLANLVDIEPTVYGGLYIEGTSDDFKQDLEVSGYDNHQTGINESEDLFLANYDTYDLHNHASIAGIPVVNGELGSDGNPEISAIGYGVTVDPGPQGKKFDESNDGYWLDAHKNALATELSSSYSDIDEIDSEVDDLRTNYLDGNPTASGTVTAGLYDGAGSIGTVDSSSGNVHIGVDGDFDLTNVEVKGDNQTSIYVDGNVELSDVEIQPDDRANALWIYASSDSEITIDGDFQGVVYAPGADIEIADGTTIDGAVVAGKDTGIGDDVEINFDRSLRTDTPLSAADENQLFEYGDMRPPIDATFVLDRSGSMGPHNPTGDTYTPTNGIEIGETWEPIPTNEPFRDYSSIDIQVKNEDGNIKTLGSIDYAHPDNWEQIRVHPDYHGDHTENTAIIGLYDHPGNDPKNKRVEATKDFINLMDQSNGDRVGVYDFSNNGNDLHSLDSDLDTAEEQVVGNAYGGTNMAAGFREALDDYEENDDEDQKRIAVLLSDGKNSHDDYNDQMDELVEDANDLNVTLYTVGLTGPEDTSIPEAKLKKWAEDTGGKFYKADSADDLSELFVTEIGEGDIGIDQDVQIGIAVRNEQETTSAYAISVSEQTVEISD